MEGSRKLRLKNDSHIRKQRSMVDKYLSVRLTYFVLILISANKIKTYANWYEEPLAIERTDYDNAWWLSNKKKASLREKEDEEIAKKREEYKNRDFKEKNIKWLYDDDNITRFPRNKWEVIDDDGDSIGYEYYFNEDGYLLIDTVTPDYEVVDGKGRRVDNSLKPIVHIISKTENSNEEEIRKNAPEIEKKSHAGVIITEGVVFREKVNFQIFLEHSISLDANTAKQRNANVDNANSAKKDSCMFFNDLENCSYFEAFLITDKSKLIIWLIQIEKIIPETVKKTFSAAESSFISKKENSKKTGTVNRFFARILGIVFILNLHNKTYHVFSQ